jgi:hypothetical protein
LDTKNKPLRKKFRKPIDMKSFITIGLLPMILVAILFLYFCWPSSEKRLIPISVFALIAGVLFEGKRLVGKWKTLIYMVIASFALSFVSFLPEKHEHHYDLDSHIEFWPYSFILIYPLEELIKRIFDSSNGLIVFFVNILHNSHSTNFS